MAQKTTRNARLEARISPDALSVVRRAAEIQGRSVSDQEAAKKTVTEMEVIRLSREGPEKFAALMLKPPSLQPALKKALKNQRSRVVY